MRVCLDACVLYPTVLRQILLKCASAGLFQPNWSSRILEEWALAVVANFPEQEGAVRVEIALAQHGFPNAEVVVNAGDLPRFELPDPNDVHVLGAAIVARAEMLVTINLRDFPRETCAAFGVEVLHPDLFLLDFLRRSERDLSTVIAEVYAAALEMGAPDIGLRKFLKKASLPRLAKAIAG